jgi:hypothetical protein
MRFGAIFSLTADKCWNSATAASFCILCNSLLTSHCTIQCCIHRTADSVIR